jgi:hypothetical protein
MAEEPEDATTTEAPQLGNLFGTKKKKAKSMNFTAAGTQKAAAPPKAARADGEWKEEESAVDMVRIGVQVESLKMDEEEVKDEKPVWSKSADAGESKPNKGYYPALSATAPVQSARPTAGPAGVSGIKSERSKFDALQEEEEAEDAPAPKAAPAAAGSDAAKKAAKKEAKRLEKERREAEEKAEAEKKAAAQAEKCVMVKVDGKEVDDTKIKIEVDACQAKYDGRRKPRPAEPVA